MDGYTQLANAIIKLAILDYKKALKREKNKFYSRDVEKLEIFFNSDYCAMLTSLDMGEIARQIRREVYNE